MNPLAIARNLAAFGLMLLDEALTFVYGTPVEVAVVDGVGPWASTIDLDAVADAL